MLKRTGKSYRIGIAIFTAPGAGLANLAFDHRDAPLLGVNAQIHGRAFAVRGRAVVAVQVAEQLTEAELQLERHFEAQRHARRHGRAFRQGRAEESQGGHCPPEPARCCSCSLRCHFCTRRPFEFSKRATRGSDSARDIP